MTTTSNYGEKKSMSRLILEKYESKAYVDSILSSQLISNSKFEGSPMMTGRNRNLSTTTATDTTVKKVRQEQSEEQGAHDSEYGDWDNLSDTGDASDSGRPDAGRRKAIARRLAYKEKRKGKHKYSPAARKVIAAEAEIHVDSDPSIKELSNCQRICTYCAALLIRG